MKRGRAFGIWAVAVLWLGLSVWSWLKPPDTLSASERRKLAQLPLLDRQSWFSGSFTGGFENYTTDQFPLRENFRELKSLFHRNVLMQRDNHGIYVENGIAAQIQYPLNLASVDHACNRVNWIYGHYLQDMNCRIFLSIVPDKHYFLADSGGYPSLDYDQLTNLVVHAMPWAEYVDLTGTLTVDDYYCSDTHWRQEHLLPAADVLCESMGIPAASGQNFQITAVDVPFYGVYRGQAALPMEAETIYTLENDVLRQCRVYNYETDAYTRIYDQSKLQSRDLYDVYLSGATALLRIENPSATTDRELIVFRDSFGSSMIPLLVHGYKTVTVVDTRYVSPAMLGNLLEFDNRDVLFLYSTILLNNSSAMK